MNKLELKEKIKGLEPLTDDQRNDIICALIGHSAIETYCFGYVNCARCGCQTGDTLGGIPHNIKVMVGHNCENCENEFNKLGWEHKLLVRNPMFKQSYDNLYTNQPYLLTLEGI